ncbi:MAG: hypothetical protein JW837_03615 [Sedimentisphaerales bacterium]|nr:hypothetical protein [Sedimentisphaerales bacterium]
MNEEPIQFPQANNPEDVGGIITYYLEDMGYIIQKIGFINNNFTVTTDKKVTEKDMSEIRISVEDRGYPISFVNE